MKLIPFLTAFLILVGPLPSFAQNWMEYSNQRDFFGVNLPGEPKVREITHKTNYSVTLPGRVYTVENGGERYSVTVIDYTETNKKHAERVKTCQAAGGDGDYCVERSALDLRGAIAEATWDFLKRDAKVTHFVYTQADLVEGHEVYLTNRDGTRTFAMIYMHENRLYVLEATVPGSSPPPLLFQQSMRFLDKEGKSIRYSSTYSNGFPAPPRAR